MKKCTKYWMMVTVLTVGFLGTALEGSGGASVDHPDTISCDSGGYSFDYWIWAPSTNDVEGVRAPIELRTNGELCQPTSDEAFASPWIAIEQGNGQGITQIGFDHEFSSSGSGEFCRFWAIGTGHPHDYDCASTGNNTFVFFEIEQYISGGNVFYAVYDCGSSGGYGNCILMSGNQAAYTEPVGSVAAETDEGCPVRIMGTASAPTNYGTSANPVEGLANSSCSGHDWGSTLHQNCSSDYAGSIQTGPVLMSTWDTRN
jgi:hypothetical protein